MILPASTPANSLAADSRGLDALKRSARDNPDQALKAAATQFEALFMNMVLKNMRESLPKDGLLSSSAGDTYTAMLDQQLSQKLAGQGTGLADMLVKQLSKSMKPATGSGSEKATANPAAGTNGSAAPPAVPKSTVSRAMRLSASIPAGGIAPAGNTTVKSSAMPTLRPRLSANMGESAATGTSGTAAATTTAAVSPDRSRFAKMTVAELKRDFVSRVSQHAQEAEQRTGVPATFMVGQAALESGWGKHEIRDTGGQSAFNLFGIKATGNWNGPTVSVTTTEYVNGVARKVVEKFRAYASYAEGFADYARVIADNPRYANVLKTAQQGIENFAQGLQRAGYATDPAYAVKLASVIKDAIKVDKLV
jgi:flagellar protein FlgJ